MAVLIFVSAPAFCQSNCFDVLNETMSFIDFGGQGIIVGCTEIQYCTKLSNAEDETINDIQITFSTGPGTQGEFMNPVNLGGFTQTSPTTYFQEVDIPAFTDLLVCISFQVDPTFDPGFNPLISGEVEVLAPNCTTPEEHDFGNIFPNQPNFVVNGQVFVSDVATADPPGTPGAMLTPSASINGNFGQNILVNGTLIFDVGTTYHLKLGSDIMMGPDAVIVVASGDDLHILDQARVIGCAEMWDRIEVENGASLTIQGNPPGQNDPGVLVRDGENGIQLHDGASLSLSKTTFLNNYRSITTPFDFAPKFFTIELEDMTTITSDGNLLPPYAGRLPSSGITFVGAQGVNVLGSVGNTIEFSNLARGIYTLQSTATFEKMLIHDILDDPATAGSSTEGIGIRALGFGQDRTLTYRGFDDGSTLDIHNCELGILADDMRLNVSGTAIGKVNRGIEVRNSDNRSIDIRDNEISARVTGVGLFHNMPTTLDLTENIVNIDNDLNTTSSATGIGIRGEENATSVFRHYRITNNLVNVQNAETGIWFQSGILPQVWQNTVDLLDPNRETYFGIDLQGSIYPNVKCNLVTGNGSDGNWRSAVAFNNIGISSPFIRCNEAHDTDIGFRFNWTEEPVQFSGNLINEHRLGMFIDDNTAIGFQEHRGNEWNGSSYGSGGQNGNWGAFISAASNALDSRFEVDPADNGTFITSTNSSNLFDPQYNDPTPNFSCTSPSNLCPNGLGSNIEGFVEDEPSSIDAVDYAVADGSVTFTECDTAMLWTAQRRLYRRLMAAPSLYANDTLLQNFVNAAAQSSVGAFHGVEKGITDVFEMDSMTIAELGSQESTIADDLGGIYSIDSTLLAGGLTQQQEAALQSERDSLLVDLRTAQSANDSLWTVIESAKVTQAQSVKSINAAISPVGEHEENEQAVNEIFLETIAVNVDTFTAQQVTDLLAIAAQCASCGGDAVFRARSLYSLYDPTYRFVEPSSCSTSRSAMPAQKVHGKGISVSPNPAKDELTVDLGKASLDNDKGHALAIYSMTGVLMLQSEMAPKVPRHIVDTAGFPAGSYYLIIYDGDVPVHTEQVVIVK